MADTIEVNIGRLPGQVLPFNMPSGATVQDALNTAELDVGSNEVRVNGDLVEDVNRILDEGDRVTLVGRIKGN